MKNLMKLVLPVAFVATAGVALIGCEEKPAAAPKANTPAPAPADANKAADATKKAADDAAHKAGDAAKKADEHK